MLLNGFNGKSLPPGGECLGAGLQRGSRQGEKSAMHQTSAPAAPHITGLYETQRVPLARGFELPLRFFVADKNARMAQQGGAGLKRR